jgi:protein TonB
LAVTPKYPPKLLAAGKKGKVLLEFVVTKNGEVCDPIVIESNDPLFSEAALRAARQWKFEPGRIGDRKVAARMRFPIIFEIEDAEPGATAQRP